MRVLHIYSSGNMGGGAAMSMCSLTTELASSNGTEVIVLVPHSSSRKVIQHLQSRGIEVHEARLPWITYPPLRSKSRNLARALFRKAVAVCIGYLSDRHIAKLIRERGIDLVHICDGVVEVGARPARKLGIPLIWHIREYVEEDHGHKYIHKSKTYRAYAKATQVICVSEALSKHYRARIPDASIATVYNGVISENELEQLSSSQAPQAESHEGASIVFLGGIRKSKGIFDALEAISRVRRLTHSPFTFDIFGEMAPEDAEEYQRFMEKSDLNEIVRYHGWQPMPIGKVATYDIQLTCSRSEAFGRITAEAMCAHTAVVGANSGGTVELIGDGRGFLYESGNVDSLTDALLTALEDVEAREAVVEKAASYAKEHFTIEQYGSRVFSLYQKAIGACRGHSRAH